jgi:hypothetical protein
MAKFWVDFNGYVCVEAKDKENAMEVFWEQVKIEENDIFHDVYLDIDGVEEKYID